MIAIIAAEVDEVDVIKELMEDMKETKKYNLVFTKGKIHDKEVVVVQCGVGKVNAARTTQILIDTYNPDYIINVGSAGSVAEDLNIQDVVIGKELIQYDFDISVLGNCEKGEICDIGDKYFYSDSRLISLCKETIEELVDKNFKVKIGRIGTADLFCGDINKIKKQRIEFGIDCAEMEGASVAQVAFLDNVPFLVIRGISDTPYSDKKMDYRTYAKLASRKTAEILDNLIVKI